MKLPQILTKLIPSFSKAISQKEDAVKLAAELFEKSSQILPLFDKLNKLSSDYTEAAANGDITNEEAQTLIADIKIIATDPAITELRTSISTKWSD